MAYTSPATTVTVILEAATADLVAAVIENEIHRDPPDEAMTPNIARRLAEALDAVCAAITLAEAG